MSFSLIGKCLSVFSVLCFLVGCSTSSIGSIGQQPKKILKKPEIKPYATDIEGMLKEGPGKFAGENYDKDKVNAELKKLPGNLTGEKAYQYLVNFFAEDYRPLVNKLDQFNTTYTISGTPEGTTSSGKSKKKLNVEILLDSSGSMAEKVDGFAKMTLAKNAVMRFASSLPEGANVSLRVFGHKGSSAEKDKQISCQSSEQVYPFSTYNQDKFSQALDQFHPTGWTPLASAMKEAKQDLTTANGTENLVYVVSDGIETCGGNPVQAAKELNGSNIKAVVNIIGFNVDDAGQKALQQVAKAGGGEFVTVNNDYDLREYFDQQQMKLWDEWYEWGVNNDSQIIDQYNQKEEELQNLTFGGFGEISKLKDKEIEHMKDALDQLESMNKIAFNEKSKAEDLIRERDNNIQEYCRNRYDSIEKILRDNEHKMQDLVRKKSQNMRDKYDKNKSAKGN